MQSSYIVDAAGAPWKRSETEGITFACQVLLSGEDGGPEAMRFRFDGRPLEGFAGDTVASVFRENPIPMWVYDRETLFFLEVNDAAIRRYGWTREEFLHRKITDIRPPSDIPRLLRSLAERPPGWYRTNRWRHRLKDGSLVSVEVAAHPTRFDGREAVLVAVYLPDGEAGSPPVVEAATGERDGNGSAAGD